MQENILYDPKASPKKWQRVTLNKLGQEEMRAHMGGLGRMKSMYQVLGDSRSEVLVGPKANSEMQCKE